MSHPNFVILYVDNPSVSVAFYSGVLGGPPVEASPTFMDFGYTFTAKDPDGHRLRVFAPGGA